MRRRLSCALLLLLGSLLASGAAAGAQPATAETARPRLAETLRPADFSADRLLVVHYRRVASDYDGWNLWTWVEGRDGRAIDFDRPTPFGRCAVVPLDAAARRVGLIARRGDWQEKDGDQDRFVDLPEGQSVIEVWLVGGDPAIYGPDDAIDLGLRVAAAFLDAPDVITLAVTGALDEPTQASLRVTRGEERGAALPILAVEPLGSAGARMVYRVSLARPVDAADVAAMRIAVGDLPSHTVFARDVLDGDEHVAPDATLGHACTPEGTTFRTWSPVASSVDLLLFAGEEAQVVPMRREPRGLWSASVAGDLHGTRYRYRFASYGAIREVADIHTSAASADSRYSVVVDLARLAPPGWGAAPQPCLQRPTDEIIYEIHVRDYSIADPACPPAHRGTYLGLTHRNPARDGGVSSGLDHLLDLGVTAVHLMPIHDFAAAQDEYNWGYWTTMFNVPESNYSTDPADPTRAIVDLRQAIQSLHAAGIRVILDVVYNHTSSSFEHSAFDQTVPYYYFRTTPDGRLRNDAGVGNSVADERAMVRKHIVDSLRFWVRQYRVDGFRFDLLGTHTPETVQAVCAALLSERDDLTLYGEPWTGGGPIQFGKGAQRGMRMAVFNDHLRGAIRGDLDGTATGFATGPGGDHEGLRRGIAGAIDDFAREPVETVNYASAHDNLTFWDKLVNADPAADDARRRAQQKLAHGIVLTAQGIAFLHGGCDFARTKEGNHNSYNAGDAINRFDWQRKAQYLDVHDYVRGLIALRRAHPAFRMADDAQVRAALRFLQTDGVVAYTLDGEAAGDSWRRILVAYNGEPTPQDLQLPPGEWTLVVDDQRAGTDPIGAASGRVRLPGYSMLVAHR